MWTIQRDGAHPVEITLPALGDDDVLIAVDATEIAGPRDTRGGIAVVGKVVEAGARGSMHDGKHVVVGPIDPCGECDVCRRGGAAACAVGRRRPNMLARQVIAGARTIVPLGDGLELPVTTAAVVAGSAAIAYTLYARASVSPREPVVVVGADTVTRFIVEILLAKGITPTVVVDPAQTGWYAWLLARGATVAPVGASDPHDRACATVAAALAAQGDGDGPRGSRPWRVIATDAAMLPLAAALCGPRATLTALACDPEISLPGSLLANEVTVTGVAGAHPDLVIEVAAMVVKGELDLAAATELRELADLARPSDPTRAVIVAIPR